MENSSFDLIQDKWRNGECPLLFGILRSSGEALGVKLNLSSVAGELLVSLEKLELTSISDWLGRADQKWIQFSELYEITDHANDLVIGVGETAQGNHGFIARSRISDGGLSWLALFSNSNPFSKCEIIEGNVMAHSTSGVLLKIPLDDPFGITTLS